MNKEKVKAKIKYWWAGKKALKNSHLYAFTLDGRSVRVKDSSNVVPVDCYWYHRDTNMVHDRNGTLLGHGRVLKKLFLNK